MRCAVRLAVLWSCLLATRLYADDPLRGPGAPPLTLTVPRDDQEHWPPGEWQPIPRTVWEQFLEARLATSEAVLPPAAFLRKAIYQGQLIDGVLRGTFQWEIARRTPEAGEVLLHPLGLYLTELRWPNQLAVWGTRADGRSVLWTDHSQSTLTGRWELSGDSILDRHEFRCLLPAAAICELTLELPSDVVLTSSAGLVSGPSPVPGGETSRWTVQPGRNADFTLSTARAPSQRKRAPLLVRESVSLSTQSEGIEAQFDFELETPGESPLTLELPANLQVLSASVGSDAPLSIQTQTDGNRRRITIDMPEPRLPRGARIRLRAFQPLDWRGMQRMPVPRLINGDVIDRQIALHVRLPYRLEDLQAPDYRLTDRRTDSDRNETWMFQSLRPDGEFRVSIAAPDPELTTESVTWIDFASETPRLRVRTRVTGGGGAVFQLQADVSREWDVVTVEPAPGEMGTLLAGFQITPAPGAGHHLLTIDLRRPLAREESLQLVVSAIGPPVTAGASIRIPELLWRNSVQDSGIVAVRGPSGYDVSSNVPVTAGGATPEQSRWLEDLAPAAPRALTLDRRDVIRRSTPAILQFEAPTPMRDALADFSVSPPDAQTNYGAQPNPAGTQLPLGRAEVLTQLCPGGREEHWHTARYQLHSPFTGVCEFQLDEAASHLELEIDDLPSPLVRSGPDCRSSQPVSIRHSVTIRYRTASGSGRVVTRTAVPFPVFSGGPLPLEWTLQPTKTCACATVGLPFARVLEAVSVPPEIRFLGPLAGDILDARPVRERTPAGEVDFDPRHDGHGAATGDLDLATTSGMRRRTSGTRGILFVEAAVSPRDVVIETWNPALTRNSAWAAFSFVLLVVVALRRLRSPFLNALAPLWLGGMLFAAWIAPAPFARITGACLVATIIGIALPRRVALGRLARGAQRDPAEPVSSGSPLVPARTLTASLLLVALSLAVDVSSQDPRPSETTPPLSIREASARNPSAAVEVLIPEHEGRPTDTVYVNSPWFAAVQAWDVSRPQPPGWLIRSADYELTWAEVPVLRAEYEVLTHLLAGDANVRLPLTGVAFDTAMSVEIDGAQETIIPAGSGDGFFVRIPAAGQEDSANDSPQPLRGATAPSAGVPGDWRSHRVVVQGFTRPGLAPEAAVHIGIPAVAGSRLRVQGAPEEPSRIRWRTLGGAAIAGAGEPLELHLGCQSWIQGDYRDPPHASHHTFEVVATLVDVYPLRLDGQTVLTLLPSPAVQRRSWTIPLSAGLTVTDVSGAPDLQWSLPPNGKRPELQIVTRRPIESPLNVTVRTVRSIDTGRESTEGVRLGPVIRQSSLTDEWIIARPAAGFDLAAAPPNGAANAAVPPVGGLSLDMNNALQDPQAFTCRIGGDQFAFLRLKPRTSSRTAVWDGSIEVYRTRAVWTANVRIEVGGAPTTIHDFEIDPRVRLIRATAVLDGADRLTRFTQSDDRVQVVLTRPYSGLQQIELQGEFDVSAGSDVPLPRARLLDSQLESASWAVSNQSGWEMLPVYPDPRPDGPTRSSPEVQPSPSALFTVIEGDPRGPTGFRLNPGIDAASAEIITMLFRREGSGWWQRTIGSVRPEGAPLRNLQLKVPPEMAAAIGITPHSDVIESLPAADGSLQVRLRPSRLRNGSYRFVVESRLAVPEGQSLWDLPRIQTESARVTSQYLLLDRRFPYRLTSANGEEISWERVPLRAVVVPRSDAVLPMRITSQSPVWTWTRFNQQQQATVVPLLDTLVWWDPDEGVHGASLLTAITSQEDRLLFRVPPFLEIDRVTLGGLDSPSELVGDQFSVSIPANHRGDPLVIRWHIEAKNAVDRTSIALLEPVGWSPGERTVAFVPASRSGPRLAQPSSPAAWNAARMSGLLAAVERQSTRTFGLDSPLLTEVRLTDSNLEGLQRSRPLAPQLKSQIDALRERWQKVHSLIAVRVGAPGEAAPDDSAGESNPWTAFVPGPDVEFAVLGEQAWTVPLQPDQPTLRQAAIITALAGAVLLLMLLQRRRVTRRLADWLADHPAFTCLMLGGIWMYFLHPRAIGVALLIIGLTLLSRRPRTADWRADTALVGPGR